MFETWQYVLNEAFEPIRHEDIELALVQSAGITGLCNRLTAGQGTLISERGH